MVTMREAYDVSVANTLVNIRAIGGIGALGVLVAFVGLYGLVASVVSQRVREFGIRMALGATPRRVLRMALTEGTLLAVAGVAIGLGLSLGGDSVAVLAGATVPNSESARLTFGEYALVVFFVLGVMAIASYLPARRAARMGLATTLRGSN
jgi:ABC-type antimicrobial peptide transport system permease subunit